MPIVETTTEAARQSRQDVSVVGIDGTDDGVTIRQKADAVAARRTTSPVRISSPATMSSGIKDISARTSSHIADVYETSGMAANVNKGNSAFITTGGNAFLRTDGPAYVGSRPEGSDGQATTIISLGFRITSQASDTAGMATVSGQAGTSMEAMEITTRRTFLAKGRIIVVSLTVPCKT